jgi:hypothetical protein
MEPQPEPEPECRPLTHQENMSIKQAVHEHCSGWDLDDDELCKKRKAFKKAMTQMMMEGQSLDETKSAVLVS